MTVVVPAHDEEAHIGDVLGTMPELVDEVVVVDDCSTDGTAEIVRAAEDARVRLMCNPVNEGVGGAMAAGYKRALEGGGDVFAKVDGDGQMDPADLPKLLDPIADGRADYAKGNRFLGRDSLASMPPVRLVGNVVLTFMTKFASGYWHVFDPQNGYTAVTRELLERIDLEGLSKGYSFENDMLVNLNIHLARVTDVAMSSRYGDEVSKMRIWRILFQFPLFLFRAFWRRVYQRYVLRDFSPIVLFLVVGIALFGWGALYGLYALWRSTTTGVFASTGQVMVSVLPLIVGFELMLQAVVLDINSTPR